MRQWNSIAPLPHCPIGSFRTHYHLNIRRPHVVCAVYGAYV
jgi:hypothetical protein